MVAKSLNPPQFDVDDNDGVRTYKLRQLVEDLIRAHSELIDEIQEIAGGGGGSAVGSLNDLTDVTLASLIDQQALVYDQATTSWINQQILAYPPELGFAGI